MKSISIIIPCFNDEISIKEKLIFLLQKLKKTKIKYEIIVINDGSSDTLSKTPSSAGNRRTVIK